MTLSRTHLIFAVALLIVVIGVYGFWYQMIADESVAVADLDTQIASKKEAVSSAKHAQATLQGRTQDELLVQQYFVPQSEVVSFINALQTLGKEQNTVVSISSVAKAGDGMRAVLVLTVTIKGDFAPVMRTIGAIEYAPYDINVSSVSLAHDTKSTWRAEMKLAVGSAALGAARGAAAPTP